MFFILRIIMAKSLNMRGRYTRLPESFFAAGGACLLVAAFCGGGRIELPSAALTVLDAVREYRGPVLSYALRYVL